jgi:hypothetical protein
MPAFAPVDRPELAVLWIGEDAEDEVEERPGWTVLELEVEVEEGVVVEEENEVDVESTSEVLVGSDVEMAAPAEPSVKTSVFCEMRNRPMPESQHPFV